MNENTFRKNLIKSYVPLRYKFLYGAGETDYTDLVLSDGLSMIRRDVNLSAGIVPIKLNNSGGWFNFLHQTNTALGDVAKIQVYVDGDAANVLTVFKGTVKDPKWPDSTVTLMLKDSASAWIDKKVGSNQSPANWYTSGRNADEIVWHMLLDEGELSGLVSPNNEDIDYVRFAAWRDQHIRPNDYWLKGKPTGQTIGKLLMMICQLTHSYIWVNNEGKVSFAPPFGTGYSYDEDNTGVERQPGTGRGLEEITKTIINDVKVRRGYSLSAGTWVGQVTDTDATSIGRFGTFPKTVEGRIFSHNLEPSAQSDLDATLVDYAYPQRFFTLKAGPAAIMEDICNEITVDDTLKGISGATPIIEEINYDLDNWVIIMRARWPW